MARGARKLAPPGITAPGRCTPLSSPSLGLRGSAWIWASVRHAEPQLPLHESRLRGHRPLGSVCMDHINKCPHPGRPRISPLRGKCSAPLTCVCAHVRVRTHKILFSPEAWKVPGMTCNHWKICFISKEPSSKMAPASERALSWNAVIAPRLTSAFWDNSRRAKWDLTLGLTSGLAASAQHLPGPPCPGDAGCAGT